MLYGVRGALWNTRSGGHPGARAVLQSDGNFVVYGSDGRPLWNSGPDRADPAASSSVATGDSMRAGQQLLAGQGLTSSNGSYRLVVQGDGNAVVYASGGRAIWNSRTAGQSGVRLVMQSDGNLVLYGVRGALWNTRSGGHPGARAVLQSDGNFVVYGSDGRPLWNSGPDRAGCRSSSTPVRRRNWSR